MDKHTEDFLQFFEDSERELAEEKQRQEDFMKALENAVFEIVNSIHLDYKTVPERIHKRNLKELHNYVVDINEVLDYQLSMLFKESNGFKPNPPSIEVPNIREFDEENMLAKKSYEKSKELIVAYYPEIYEANSEVLRMINFTCYIAMSEFETGFNFLCLDYLEAFYEED